MSSVPISSIVEVNITRETAVPTATGFGIPLIIGVHTKTSGSLASYSNYTEVLEDFVAADPEAKIAAALFGQQRRPTQIKIGKLVANVRQKVNIDISTVANSTLYTVTIDGTAYTYTSDASATEAEIIDGLISAIEAADLMVTCTDNTTDFDIEADIAGEGFSVVVDSNMTLTTTTANKNPATQLQDIIEDNFDDDFYYVLPTSTDKNDILNLANDIQARRKRLHVTTHHASAKVAPQVHIQTITFSADFVTDNVINLKVNGVAISPVTFTSDHATTIAAVATAISGITGVGTATSSGRVITVPGDTVGVDIPITRVVVTGGVSQPTGTVVTTQDGLDLEQELDDNIYDRTSYFYSADPVGGAATGLKASSIPGSETWKFSKLSGVSTENLTTGERNILLAKNANIFVDVAGIGILEEGVTCGGEYIDVMIGVDWIQSTLETELLAGIVNAGGKIPYEDSGVSIVVNYIKRVLDIAVQRNILAKDPAYTITAPKVADISVVDKGNRYLPDVQFVATLSGAIHKVQINGKVTL